MHKIEPYTYVGLKYSTKILFQASFRNAPIKYHNADLILDLVCNEYKVDKIDLLGKDRSEPIRSIRHIAIYLILKHCGIPLKKVGAIFSNRDHSTIIYSRDYVNAQIDINKKYDKKIKALSERTVELLNSKGK